MDRQRGGRDRRWTCDGWTTKSLWLTGTTGLVSETSGQLVNNTTTSCVMPRRFYCFETH